jgi:hypothetical protein
VNDGDTHAFGDQYSKMNIAGRVPSINCRDVDYHARTLTTCSLLFSADFAFGTVEHCKIAQQDPTPKVCMALRLTQTSKLELELNSRHSRDCRGFELLPRVRSKYFRLDHNYFGPYCRDFGRRSSPTRFFSCMNHRRLMKFARARRDCASGLIPHPLPTPEYN